ncbi:excinuclease ABC subunit B [Candidatus Magnetoovum chiemensis]|nr:excinuclease ABC subunit B [Candidatus Magnetoovum chiemensis]
MDEFKIVSDFTPRGDQPKAVAKLAKGIGKRRHQVLLGVTGSGKTFTIAHVIQKVKKPTLVIAHNKTLAAQLYGEFKELFPFNAVEYFVSYYDYYQPEAYIPKTDTYIDKDSSINEDIDRLRHSATMSVLERRDVIVVASVSCIYGIGSPEDYMGMHLIINEGDRINRDDLLFKLSEIQYQRSEAQLQRGALRVRGDIIDIFPAFTLDKGIRLEFFGDDIDAIYEFNLITNEKLRRLSSAVVYPNTHWITPRDRIEPALKAIELEMRITVDKFLKQGKVVEARRIEQRTRFDIEMLKEFGFCHGIENYSRHLSGRAPGDPPNCLMDYFPDDFLIVIDESHVTVPQIGGMYEGDRSRKQTLIDYGFRLPSALDNRPLKFHEFEKLVSDIIYVSATPGDYELGKAQDAVVEQIIRPTGLIDPKIEVRGVSNQVEDLLEEIRNRALVNERVLITTLTKKMAEDLTSYYNEIGVRAKYLHSDIDTLDRVKIIKDFRSGVFDVLIGVNLLREGLDLPEVSLVAVFDADKEGFLRSARSLIQTSGRAARNINGMVIFYADRITGSMKSAIDETNRRRKKQISHNQKMNITPSSVKSNIKDILSAIYETSSLSDKELDAVYEERAPYGADYSSLEKLHEEMKQAAEELDFERAASLRDKIKRIKEKNLSAT